MARNKPKELLGIVGDNLQRISREHDLSSRDIASRADMPQATVYKLLEGKHNPSLGTLEQICRALLVSPAVLMIPFLPTSMLLSKRIPKLIEAYSKLTPEQRDKVEDSINSMLTPIN